MVSPEGRITTVQAAIAVTSMVTAAGLLTLPRNLAEAMGTPDGWIVVILGGLIAMAAGTVAAKLSQRFPGQTFYQYSQIVAGKGLGILFSLLLILYFILVAGFEARIQAEVVNHYLLDQTPVEVTVLVFLFTGIYLITGGLHPMIRLFQLFFPIILFIFLFSLVVLSPLVEIDNLRPVLGQGITPVINGLKAATLPYLGFEVMFILTAYMKKPEKAVKAVLAGLAFPLVFNLAGAIISMGILTVEGTKPLTWPTLEIAKEIEFPGFFYERFEMILILFWMTLLFTTFVGAYFYASLGLAQLTGKNRRTFIFALSPLMYMVAMYPPDYNQVFRLGDFFGIISYFTAGLIPLGLWVVSVWRRKGHGPSQKMD